MLDNHLWRKDNESSEKIKQHVTQNIISNSDQVDRISTYELYWKFYNGEHWKFFNKTMLRFNYIRAFVNKLNQFLLGKDAFTFRVTSFDSESVSTTLEEVVEKFYLYHWNRNKKLVLAYEMLQTGSITGDVWIGVTWSENKQFVEIKVLDSRHVFPKMKNGSKTEVENITIRETLVNHPLKYNIKVTEYGETYYKTWFQKTTSEKVADSEKFEGITYVNPIGEIPIIHIQNSLNGISYFGISDIEDVISLNKKYNELAQELGSIIDYHTAPTTVVKGATLSNLSKKVGNVWSGLPPEADVFNLGLDVDLNGIQNFMGLIKTSMHELSDIPENFLGKIQPISNTSAAALMLTYQSIFSKSEMKEIQYGAGISEINRLVFKLNRIYAPENKIFEKLSLVLSSENIDLDEFEYSYSILPVFKYGFPQDKQVEYALAETSLRLRLDSRRRILNNLGVNNVPELLAEIEQDVLAQAALDRQVAEIVNVEPDNNLVKDSTDPKETEKSDVEKTLNPLFDIKSITTTENDFKDL